LSGTAGASRDKKEQKRFIRVTAEKEKEFIWRFESLSSEQSGSFRESITRASERLRGL